MIDRAGEVRVVDFGLARGTWSPSATDYAPTYDPLSERMTRIGVALGTFEYMAPEARHGEADARSDQFSFAMAAWESLAGQLPFDVHKHEYKPEWQEAFTVASAIPSAVRPALERALSYAPNNRFPDLPALLRAMQRRKRIRRWGLAVVATVAPFATAAVALLTGPSAPTSQVAAAGTISTAAVQPNGECDRLHGDWAFNTVVTWANDVRYHGINGYFTLQVRPLSGCKVELDLHKVGSTGHKNTRGQVRQDNVVADAIPTDGGHRIAARFNMGAQKHARIHYVFDLRFESGSVVGTYWQQPTPESPREASGFLRGGRERPDRDLLPDVTQLPCDMRCATQCPDPVAAQTCVAACGTESEQTDCGLPTASFLVPERPSAAIRQGAGAIRATVDNSKRRRRCEKAAKLLDGTWQLYVSDEGAQELQLAGSGCGLRIVGGAYEDAEVDAQGAWTLFRGGVVQVSLVGWNPAFGTTRSGKPAAAYRVSKRSPPREPVTPGRGRPKREDRRDHPLQNFPGPG